VLDKHRVRIASLYKRVNVSLCMETVIVDLVREEQFIYGPGTLRSTSVAIPQLPSSIYLERTVLQLNSSQVGTKSLTRWTFQLEHVFIYVFLYVYMYFYICICICIYLYLQLVMILEMILHNRLECNLVMFRRITFQTVINYKRVYSLKER